MNINFFFRKYSLSWYAQAILIIINNIHSFNHWPIPILIMDIASHFEVSNTI